MTLANNLRLGIDGKLFCSDRENVDAYVLRSTLGQKGLPQAVVLVSREDYLRLLNAYQERKLEWELKNLILAA